MEWIDDHSMRTNIQTAINIVDGSRNSPTIRWVLTCDLWLFPWLASGTFGHKYLWSYFSLPDLTIALNAGTINVVSRKGRVLIIYCLKGPAEFPRCREPNHRRIHTSTRTSHPPIRLSTSCQSTARPSGSSGSTRILRLNQRDNRTHRWSWELEL